MTLQRYGTNVVDPEQEDLRKRLSAAGNFITAPFKNIPNAIRTIGSGLSSLRPTRESLQTEALTVVKPSQSDISMSKLSGSSPLTTLGPVKPAGPAYTPPKTPQKPAPAANRVLSAPPTPTQPAPVQSPNMGFQTQLDPNDPAAIGGAMSQTKGMTVPPVQFPPLPQASTQPPVPQIQPAPPASSATQDSLSEYEKAILESMRPGQQETELQKRLAELSDEQAKIQELEQKDLGAIRDRSTLLPFLTGQSARLQQNVQGMLQGVASRALPLKERLAMEQAQRQAAITSGQTARQFELDRREQARQEAKDREVTPIEVGGRLVNPKTGEVIYEPPGTAEKPMTLSPGETVFDPSTGRVIFTAPERPSASGGVPTIKEINGTSYQWDESSGQWVQPSGAMGAGSDSAAIETLSNKLALIDGLMTSPGMAGSVGPYGFARWTPFNIDASERQDFAAGVQQLIAKDTMDVLLNLKKQGGTLGALSDQERILLQSAASKIGTWMQRDKQGNPTGKFEVSEDAFKRELQTLRDLTQSALQRAGGGGGDANDPDFQALRNDPDLKNYSDAQIRDILGKTKEGSVSTNAQGVKLQSVKIGNKNVVVRKEIAPRLEAAAREFKQATGQDLQVNQDYRSSEHQAELYAKSQRGEIGRAAPPGYSRHESGLAIDVTNWREAEKFLRKYGFKNDLADDRNHFSIGEFA